jgi:hypothetical protein
LITPTIEDVGSTVTQPAAAPLGEAVETSANPLALWHLLSLDAPSVAAVWTWFIARIAGIRLPTATIVAMFLAVWILYAADRLLDARALGWPLCNGERAPGLELRHLFHHRFRTRFLSGIVLATCTLAVLLPRLQPAALRLYTIEGALLFGWFLLLHAMPRTLRLPKEFAVGVFFAAACFTPTVARHPGLALSLLPAATAFTILCTLNCLYIHRWESGADTVPAHAWVQLAAGNVQAICVAEVAGCAVLAATLRAHFAAMPIACGLAALLLLGLDRIRGRLDRTVLRAAADLALLTPLLIAPFIR